MKPAKHRQEGKGPIELIEEAFHLLRLAPASTLACYYLGSLPFILVLLFFWSDMSRSAFAEQRLAAGALGVSLFFFWMKLWQAVFAQALLARLSGEPAPNWTFLRLWRMGLIQSILQPSGLFLLSAAFVILIPFGWTYAFYQNVTVLGDGEGADLRQVFKRAWRQARLWPGQNHQVLFLLQPFALFVFVNLITAALGVPFLLSKLLGVETAFTHSTSALLNTTFFAAICGLTYLCLDPILKTIFVLRCFYGESLKTGRDLKAELKSLVPNRKLAGVLGLIILLNVAGPCSADGLPIPTGLCPPAQHRCWEELNFQSASTRFMAPMLADGPESPRQNQVSLESPPPPPPKTRPPPRPSVSPPALDRSIDEVLHQRQFSWRMPREKLREKDDNGKGTLEVFLEGILDTLRGWAKAVGRWLDAFLRWLTQYLWPSRSTGSTGLDWMSAFYGLLWLVAIAIVSALVFLLFRVWKNRRESPDPLAAEAIAPALDVADENVGADQLPEDGWLQLARELLDKGELRLALRAYYFAGLAHLAEGNLITIAKFKSNRDYERELQRRAHAFPEVLGAFGQTVSIFDRVWYGLHEVNLELVTHFAGQVEMTKSFMRLAGSVRGPTNLSTRKGFSHG